MNRMYGIKPWEMDLLTQRDLVLLEEDMTAYAEAAGGR